MTELTILKELYVNKTRPSKECDIFRYWYFLNYCFKFKRNVCNRCHDLLMMSIILSDIAILNNKGSDYCCIISSISKNEVLKMLIWLKKVENYKKSGNIYIYIYKFMKSYIKMGKSNHKIWWYWNPKRKVSPT